MLAVGALAHIGFLGMLNNLIFGAEINITRLIAGNVILGGFSAILDNVPLVAAAIKMFPAGISPAIWVLLALSIPMRICFYLLLFWYSSIFFLL